MPLVESQHEELLSARVAVLATNGPDGRPQLSPVWFLVDGDVIKISATAGRQKSRNLQADPRCTFLAFHRATDNYYVEIRGDAVIEPDSDYVFADRIGAKYDADLRTFDAPDETRVLVAIRAARVNVIDLRD